MAILGITNRTENWKTARHFAPLFGANSVRLARRLLDDDEERAKLQPGDVRLELFWCGMRDHLHGWRAKPEEKKEALSTAYRDLFRGLSEEIKGFDGFRAGPDNYAISTKGWESKLASNLRNTEVDIVLESPSHLFIGEVKHLSRFGASGGDFLTHQLIRQYVAARILLKLRGDKRTVVPFVVGDDRDYLAKTLQVQFMLKHGRMHAENILTWSDIEALR